MSEIVKHLGGRPTDYRPEHCEALGKIIEYGATDPQIAALFGVTVRTIRNWMDEYPEFFQAVTLAKMRADGTVERGLYNRAKSGDVIAAKFWLTNRQRDNWKEKTTNELTGPGGIPLNAEAPKIDWNKLSEDDRQAFRALLEKAMVQE